MLRFTLLCDLQEVSCLGRIALPHHRNLVRLKDVYDDTAAVRIVMDHYGEEIGVYLMRLRVVSEDIAGQIMQQLTQAVHHCHSAGR